MNPSKEQLEEWIPELEDYSYWVEDSYQLDEYELIKEIYRNGSIKTEGLK